MNTYILILEKDFRILKKESKREKNNCVVQKLYDLVGNTDGFNPHDYKLVFISDAEKKPRMLMPFDLTIYV